MNIFNSKKKSKLSPIIEEDSEEGRKSEEESSSFEEIELPIKRNRINIVDATGMLANKPKKRIRRDFDATLIGRKDEMFEDDEYEAYTKNKINLKGYRQRYYIECINDNLEIIKKWFWDNIKNFYYVRGSFKYDYEEGIYSMRIVTQLNEGKKYDFFNTLPSSSINLSACSYFWTGYIDNVNEYNNIFINYEEKAKHLYTNMKELNFNNNIFIKKNDFELMLQSARKLNHILEDINRKNFEENILIKDFKLHTSSSKNSSSSSSSLSSSPIQSEGKISSKESKNKITIIEEKEPKIKKIINNSKKILSKKDEKENDLIIIETHQNEESLSSNKEKESEMEIEEEKKETKEEEKEKKEEKKEDKETKEENKEEKVQDKSEKETKEIVKKDAN